MGQSRPFNTVDSKIQYKFLPMTGFEPWTSGVGSDHCPIPTNFCYYNFLASLKLAFTSDAFALGKLAQYDI